MTKTEEEEGTFWRLIQQLVDAMEENSAYIYRQCGRAFRKDAARNKGRNFQRLVVKTAGGYRPNTLGLAKAWFPLKFL